jgi:aspartyl-tRNA(Asn)/glutamyl-tRNA(Gln) amidotransferase subunit C
MEISSQDVRRLAELTRIGISDAEAEALQSDLASILGHVQTMSEIDTSGVDVTATGSGRSNISRPDELGPSLSQDEVLANAPRRRDGFFVVPRVLEGE